MRSGLDPNKKRQILWVVAIVCIVVLLDQVSKALVVAYIPEGSETVLSHPREFFWLTHQRNTGLVGGMFRGSVVVPYVAPVFASAVLVYLFRHLDPLSKLQSVAYGLVAGGAIGNLIDRFRLGSVTDFIQVHFYFVPFDFPWKLYPAFNIADSAICVGVAALIILTWKHPQANPPGNDHAADAD
ncbi:MAG: signal peptidase II [Candidatus Hydrogenedentales bacterium]|jgi:signal peptidase II